MTTIAAVLDDRGTAHLAADTHAASDNERLEPMAKLHVVADALVATAGTIRVCALLRRTMIEDGFTLTDDGAQDLADRWWRATREWELLTAAGNLGAGAILAGSGGLWRIWDRSAMPVTEWADGSGGVEARAALHALRHLQPAHERPLTAVRAAASTDVHTLGPFDVATVRSTPSPITRCA